MVLCLGLSAIRTLSWNHFILDTYEKKKAASGLEFKAMFSSWCGTFIHWRHTEPNLSAGTNMRSRNKIRMARCVDRPARECCYGHAELWIRHNSHTTKPFLRPVLSKYLLLQLDISKLLLLARAMSNSTTVDDYSPLVRHNEQWIDSFNLFSDASVNGDKT